MLPFTWDGFLINDNIIKSSGDGIHGTNYFGYFGAYMYNDSSYMMGNIEFNRNQIDAGNLGMYLNDFDYWGYYMYGNSSFLMGDVLFNDNVINTRSNSIWYHGMAHHGDHMYDDSSYVMGNIEFNLNQIVSGHGDGIYLSDFDEWGYYMYGDSSFTMGDVLINDNWINASGGCSSYEGIEIGDLRNHGAYLYNGSTFQMGNVELCRNHINSDGMGMDLDNFVNWGYHMEGNNSYLMGDVLINDNWINARDEDGIDHNGLDHYGEHMHYDSTYKMGNVEFCRNHIDSKMIGIDILSLEYWGRYLYDNASYMMGDVRFDDNWINSTGNYGLEISGLRELGNRMNNASSYEMGNVTMDRNHIIAGAYDYGMDLSWFVKWGCEMTGNATFVIGNVQFNNNTITSVYKRGINMRRFENWGYKMYGSTFFTMGDFLVADNEIVAGESGIYLDDCQQLGYELHDQAQVEFGNVAFNGNTITITSSDNGIYLNVYDLWKNVFDAATVALGELLVDSNNITNAEYGIHLYETDNFTISNNKISDGGRGIYLSSSSDNTVVWNMIVNNSGGGTGVHLPEGSNYTEIHGNCFYDNEPQAMDNGTDNNWTGNYWSDYTPPGAYPIDGTVGNEDTNPLEKCPLIAPLSLSKTDDVGDCVDPGDLITYTICYDNLQNPDTAVHNVTINDTLPAGVTFASASGTGGYNAGTRNVTWDIGMVHARAPETCVTLNVTVDTGTEGQTLTNCATIESDETEPTTACATTDVCEGEPTPTPTPYPKPIKPASVPVPALTPPGIIALIGLLVVAGSVVLRRRE